VPLTSCSTRLAKCLLRANWIAFAIQLLAAGIRRKRSFAPSENSAAGCASNHPLSLTVTPCHRTSTFRRASLQRRKEPHRWRIKKLSAVASSLTKFDPILVEPSIDFHVDHLRPAPSKNLTNCQLQARGETNHRTFRSSPRSRRKIANLTDLHGVPSSQVSMNSRSSKT
jgi:hypothetical protein